MDSTDAQSGSSPSAAAHRQLEKAKADTAPLKLREVNTTTTELLNNLNKSLGKMSGFKRTVPWFDAIKKLQENASMSRIIIGVLGDTGSGKSSLINAVLDEERVVPTNCMRACTAVITEISYNISKDPAKKYRAEIQFVTQADWTQELLQLYRDLFDANGKLILADIRNPDCEAGSAYATLRAVYPHLKDEELEQTHPTALANHPSIREVIGTNKFVEVNDPDEFYAKIQAFVDSEESGLGMESQERKMAYWPLIKVVRVFLKSEILSTGVVLVDLPGGRDSNTTRAAVAAKYIKECTRLWVVAPINRAVDDKTAKTLMGHTFKQQLKYDGTYSSITFICTKADDIALDEAADTLGIKNPIRHEQDRYESMESEIDAKKKDVKTAESMKMGLLAQYKVMCNQADTWQGIYQQAANGEPAFTPFESPRKRKRQTSDMTSVARKRNEYFELSDTEESADDDADLNTENSNSQRQPVSAEAALDRLNELKRLKQSTREQKKQLINHIRQLKEIVKELITAHSNIKVNMYRTCIQGRNIYARGEIKKDFAFGLRELDEELLAEQQEDDQKQLTANVTDYDKIGRALPVFCVSSRGYQQLRGRMKKDARVLGFTSLDDTEIPGLRKHTLELAAAIQASQFQRQLNEIGRVLRGMDLFLAGDEAGPKLSDAEEKQERQYLDDSLKKLGESLGELVAACMSDCHEAIRRLLQRMPKATSNASGKALATVTSWGAAPQAGGLRFPTYRATCRRRGAFKGAAGPRDFNEGKYLPSAQKDRKLLMITTRTDLLKPLKSRTAVSWDKTFNKKLPDMLDDLSSTSEKLIKDFHGLMKCRRFLVERNDLVQSILVKHITALTDKLAHVAKDHKKLVLDTQRDANRVFYPVISEAMRPAYDHCAQQRGAGCFIVIKQHMEKHVECKKNTMFKDAASNIADAVNNLMEELEIMIRKDINGVISTMEQDYASLVETAATESDNRIRKLLRPDLNSFYEKLVASLALIEEQAATPTELEIELVGVASDDEYRPDGYDSE